MGELDMSPVCHLTGNTPTEVDNWNVPIVLCD